MSDLKDYKWTVGQQWVGDLPESVAPPQLSHQFLPESYRAEDAAGVSYKHVLIVAAAPGMKFSTVADVTAGLRVPYADRTPAADAEMAQYICDLHNAALAERSK